MLNQINKLSCLPVRSFLFRYWPLEQYEYYYYRVILSKYPVPSIQISGTPTANHK